MCTTEPPETLQIIGQSRFVQARICRRHDRAKSKEDYAMMLGGKLPFLEHELHQQVGTHVSAPLLFNVYS